MKFRRFMLGNMAVNAYILFDDEKGKAVLFDAPADAATLLDFLDENKLDLEYIFLTHGHFDHIDALDAIKSATGAKVIIHKDEEKYLNDSSLNLTFVPLPELSADILVQDGDVFDFTSKPKKKKTVDLLADEPQEKKPRKSRGGQKKAMDLLSDIMADITIPKDESGDIIDQPAAPAPKVPLVAAPKK